MCVSWLLEKSFFRSESTVLYLVFLLICCFFGNLCYLLLIIKSFGVFLFSLFLTTYNPSSVTQQTTKLVTSLRISDILVLKYLSLTCAIASGDRTWLSIGSHSLSPSDMFICLLLSHQFICCKISGDLQKQKNTLLMFPKLNFVFQC